MHIIWKEMIKPNYDSVMFKSSKEGVEKVSREDDYVLLATVPSAQYLHGYPCKFRELGRAFR